MEWRYFGISNITDLVKDFEFKLNTKHTDADKYETEKRSLRRLWQSG